MLGAITGAKGDGIMTTKNSQIELLEGIIRDCMQRAIFPLLTERDELKAALRKTDAENARLQELVRKP